MSEKTPVVYLVRHGQTEWALSGRHTGRSDIPLTAQGEQNAMRLGPRLKGFTVAQVWSSPSQRARRTCELAGFAAMAKVDEDLAEWDYGAYEGLTSAQIKQQQPDWFLFRDGCPKGEAVAQIGARADRVVTRLRAVDGNILIFSSGHFLRVLASRWLGLEPGEARLLALQTASLSMLGYEHGLCEPVLQLWNDGAANGA